MKVDFDALEPPERRLILVASDETYRRLAERVDWATIAKTVAFRVASATAPALLVVPFVGAALGDALAKSGYLGAEWTRVARELEALRRPSLVPSEIPIPHLAPTEAARRFRFDHALPIDGAAYVLNPVRSDHYLPPAVANERLAQEKLAAFLRIVAALGAAEVAVTSGESLDREAAANAQSPLPDAAGQLGLEVRFAAGHRVERTVVARFERPRTAPHVPEELAAWLRVDPLLEGLARNRLDARLAEIACALSFHDGIDLGAKACAEIERKGIDVGGRFRAVAASRWTFHVRFHQDAP